MWYDSSKCICGNGKSDYSIVTWISPRDYNKQRPFEPMMSRNEECIKLIPEVKNNHGKVLGMRTFTKSIDANPTVACPLDDISKATEFEGSFFYHQTDPEITTEYADIMFNNEALTFRIIVNKYDSQSYDTIAVLQQTAGTYSNGDIIMAIDKDVFNFEIKGFFTIKRKFFPIYQWTIVHVIMYPSNKTVKVFFNFDQGEEFNVENCPTTYYSYSMVTFGGEPEGDFVIKNLFCGCLAGFSVDSVDMTTQARWAKKESYYNSARDTRLFQYNMSSSTVNHSAERISMTFRIPLELKYYGVTENIRKNYGCLRGDPVSYYMNNISAIYLKDEATYLTEKNSWEIHIRFYYAAYDSTQPIIFELYESDNNYIIAWIDTDSYLHIESKNGSEYDHVANYDYQLGTGIRYVRLMATKKGQLKFTLNDKVFAIVLGTEGSSHHNRKINGNLYFGGLGPHKNPCKYFRLSEYISFTGINTFTTTKVQDQQCNVVMFYRYQGKDHYFLMGDTKNLATKFYNSHPSWCFRYMKTNYYQPMLPMIFAKGVTDIIVHKDGTDYRLVDIPCEDKQKIYIGNNSVSSYNTLVYKKDGDYSDDFFDTNRVAFNFSATEGNLAGSFKMTNDTVPWIADTSLATNSLNFTGNWTIEFFYYATSHNDKHVFCRIFDNLIVTPSGLYTATVGSLEPQTWLIGVPANSYSLNSWHHMAICHASGKTTYSFHVDGETPDTVYVKGTATAKGKTILFDAGYTPSQNSSIIQVGGNPKGSYWLDEFRISYNRRYTKQSITVPVETFTNKATYTAILLHFDEVEQ